MLRQKIYEDIDALIEERGRKPDDLKEAVTNIDIALCGAKMILADDPTMREEARRFILVAAAAATQALEV
jgi:hypothetical protein